MNYKSKFSFSKFNKIFSRRALLMGGPGALFFIYFLLMRGKGQVFSDNLPEWIAYPILIILMVAITATIFIAPAFYLGPLSQCRRSNIQFIDGKIIYRYAKSGTILFTTYYIYTVNKISSIDINSKKITIMGDISLEEYNNNRKVAETRTVNTVKIPNAYNDIEWLTDNKTTGIISQRGV